MVGERLASKKTGEGQKGRKQKGAVIARKRIRKESTPHLIPLAGDILEVLFAVHSLSCIDTDGQEV